MTRGLSAALRDVAARLADAMPNNQELSWEAWSERAEQTVDSVLDEFEADGGIPQGVTRDVLQALAVAEAIGLGALDALLADETVLEVLVNDPVSIFVDRGEGLEQAPVAFSDDRAVYNAAHRLVSEVGALLDASNPVADIRRTDGSRVRVVLPPVSVRGTIVSIKKAPQRFFGLDDLVAQGVLSANVADFLEGCVRGGRNIVVAGGPSSGRSTLIAALAGASEPSDRIVTVEEAAELRIAHDHVVPLESRPADPEGRGAVSVGELVSIALRMRPDRLVVGDLGPDSALDTVRAMSGACPGGVIAGVGGDDPRDAASRVETLCLMSGRDLPSRAIREYFASSADVIVVVQTPGGGERRVTHVTCVNGIDVDLVALEDVFVYERGDSDDDGRFTATGFVPKFWEDLKRRGVVQGRDVFKD
jgi:pilus assembly protein CpaF